MSNRVKPPPIDPQFQNMTMDQVLSEIENLKTKLNDLKTQRNFVQQEREMIESYYKISIDEQKQLDSKIEKEAKLIENQEINHKLEINAFTNKYQHLEFEHENFIEKTLHADAEAATNQEEEKRKERENIFNVDKVELKNQLKNDIDENITAIEKEKEKLKGLFDKTKNQLEESLRTVKNNYEIKIKNLESDLELRLKIEIHELEERKNLHRNNLEKAFDERMKNWKEESIQQIRENINLIKTNTENYDHLVHENEVLMNEEKALDKEIAELSEKLRKSEEKHAQILNRLKKYHNQEINLQNMKSKINSLKAKNKDIDKKSKEAFENKAILMQEINEIIVKYKNALEKFKERAEYKNILLDNHINNQGDKYLMIESEIEEILRTADSLFNSSEFKISRDDFYGMLDKIKFELTEKSKRIKALKYSISKATKVR